jgi:general secretion pathway protein I
MKSVRNIPTIRIKGNGGFTLLEVLLAFVVFALSFTAVLEILSGSMRNTVRAREYSEVALISQSVMDQLGVDIPLEPGTTHIGESGEYEWEVNLDLYVEQDENARTVELGDLTGIELLQVDLLVSWGKPPREKSMSFSTVRAMLANRLTKNL